MEKQNMNPVADRLIREALEGKARKAGNPEFLLERINREIMNQEKENHFMNKQFKLRGAKPLMAALLIVIVTAATSFAATHFGGFFTSHSKDTFYEFPTVNQVEKAVGYTPAYVESFANGFTFKQAVTRSIQAFDSENNKTGEYEGISFYYTKDGTKDGPLGKQTLSLNTDPAASEPAAEGLGPNEEKIPAGGIDLIYSKVVSKVVPPGYVPTAEEQEKMARQELWISEGAEEVEISVIQYVSWIKGGVSYNIMENGFGLEKAELVAMAEEIIGAAE